MRADAARHWEVVGGEFQPHSNFEYQTPCNSLVISLSSEGKVEVLWSEILIQAEGVVRCKFRHSVLNPPAMTGLRWNQWKWLEPSGWSQEGSSAQQLPYAALALPPRAAAGRLATWPSSGRPGWPRRLSLGPAAFLGLPTRLPAATAWNSPLISPARHLGSRFARAARTPQDHRGHSWPWLLQERRGDACCPAVADNLPSPASSCLGAACPQPPTPCLAVALQNLMHCWLSCAQPADIVSSLASARAACFLQLKLIRICPSINPTSLPWARWIESPSVARRSRTHALAEDSRVGWTQVSAQEPVCFSFQDSQLVPP